MATSTTPGRTNLVGVYFVGEYGFPHVGLDLLSRAMPSIRARYPTFAKFAAAPIDDLFGMDRLRRAVRREATTLESGVLFNRKDGFHFEPLPPLAQIAPARDIALLDVNGDGTLDLVVGQNDFSPEPQVGRHDGGVGLVLLGDGHGHFEPLDPEASGIVVPEEVRRLAVVDVDGDGRPDLVLRVAPGALRCFTRRADKPRYKKSSPDARVLSNCHPGPPARASDAMSKRRAVLEVAPLSGPRLADHRRGGNPPPPIACGDGAASFREPGTAASGFRHVPRPLGQRPTLSHRGTRPRAPGGGLHLAIRN